MTLASQIAKQVAKQLKPKPSTTPSQPSHGPYAPPSSSHRGYQVFGESYFRRRETPFRSKWRTTVKQVPRENGLQRFQRQLQESGYYNRNRYRQRIRVDWTPRPRNRPRLVPFVPRTPNRPRPRRGGGPIEIPTYRPRPTFVIPHPRKPEPRHLEGFEKPVFQKPKRREKRGWPDFPEEPEEEEGCGLVRIVTYHGPYIPYKVKKRKYLDTCTGSIHYRNA